MSDTLKVSDIFPCQFSIPNFMLYPLIKFSDSTVRRFGQLLE